MLLEYFVTYNLSDEIITYPQYKRDTGQFCLFTAYFYSSQNTAHLIVKMPYVVMDNDFFSVSNVFLSGHWCLSH